MSKRKVGICKLTGKKGEFVKSHIIPQAFSRPDPKGEYFIQYGETQKRPIRRWSSWYDDHLVIREGEDILSELDDFAVKELSKYYLVWRSWGGNNRLPETVETDRGVCRVITDINQYNLRLFCLSLLWRAASSDLPEMSEIVLAESELKIMKELLIKRDIGPLSFYPCTLTQLSTLGPTHNLSPVKVEDQNKESEVYRFYFDGLIIRFHIDLSSLDLSASDCSIFIAHSQKLFIPLIDYNNSFQKENLGLTLFDYKIKYRPKFTFESDFFSDFLIKYTFYTKHNMLLETSICHVKIDEELIRFYSSLYK